MSNSVKPKLLVIDDEPAIRKILAAFFAKKFEVETLDKGKETMRWLEQNKNTSLIILDLNLEDGFSGLEVLKSIRNTDSVKHIPVIILSGKESSKDRIETLNAGADDYMIKPFNPDELEARINSIMRRVNR